MTHHTFRLLTPTHLTPLFNILHIGLPSALIRPAQLGRRALRDHLIIFDVLANPFF